MPMGEIPGLQRHQGRRHFEKGIAFFNAGKWKQALREFEDAARFDAKQLGVHYSRGVTLTHLDRFDEAILSFERELANTPNHPSSLTEIGTCLARTGKPREGILYLQRGLSLWPNMPLALYSLGLALLTEKHRKEAITVFDRAILLDRSYINSYRGRGLAYAMGDEEEKAHADFAMAATLDSKDYNAMIALGSVFCRKSRELQGGHLFEMAAKIAPDIALAQMAFGNFLVLHKQYEMGLGYIDRALELDPLYAPSHVARGFAYFGQGRVEEAVTSYRKAIDLSPDDPIVVGAPLFGLQHNPGVTKAELLDAHRKWGMLARSEAPKDRFAFANNPDSKRKPRIGLVSADMRGHAVSFLVLRAIEALAALGYEIYCYKTDRRFGDDHFTDRYKAIAKSWEILSDLDDEGCAALIAEHEIDILFDLSGHTTGHRLSLFAMRAAPIQLTWAGYVGTVGLDTMDGIIADAVEIPPEDDAFYLESVIRLPDCYVCYNPPAEAPAVQPLPALKKDEFTFGCFNRPGKLNAEVARAWAKILELAPSARILMVYGSLAEEKTREAVYDILESGGLGRDRVELVGEPQQTQLLEAYSERVDLALDPFPYSGGVTTLEAMWMGVPTVTLVGETFAGRHAATHLTAAGLSNFCAHSIDEYIELAAGWTKRREELAALRAGLRDRVAASPLNDPVRFANNLDEALMRLWEDWCASHPKAASEIAGAEGIF
nr:tetratricopeptide repeat protein [Methyloferula stellata]